MTVTHLAHAASTLMMTGVIWFVQIVHYPLLRFADSERFTEFSAAYQGRTTWVVLPLMLVELGTALYLVIRPSEGTRALAIAGLVLLGVIWLSTAFLQVPLHRHLESGLSERAIEALVMGNWLRTICWSARSVIALRLLAM